MLSYVALAISIAGGGEPSDGEFSDQGTPQAAAKNRPGAHILTRALSFIDGGKPDMRHASGHC